MLNKLYRIQKTKDFQKIFKNTKPIFCNNLSLRVYENKFNKEKGLTRFGFVVNNKVDKRATRRNALKRQLRQIARSLIFEIESGYDVVVFVKNSYPYPFVQADIRKEFEFGLKKAGILKNG